MLNNIESQITGIAFGMAVGYLIGSISWSIIISRIFYKFDIRKIGSGNAGATNILRRYGFKIGFITFILDALKVIIAAAILRLIQIGFNQESEMVNFGILAVVIGHAWPIFHRFKGGKGASCMWGAMLLLNVYIGLIVWALTFLILILSKYMSVSSILFGILSAIFFTIITFADVRELQINSWFFFKGHKTEYSVYVFWFVVMLVMVLHRANIERLFEGREKKTVLLKKNKK